MSYETELQALERNVKEAKRVLDLGNAFERLCSNKDFRAVIKAAYFEQEAIRLVHLKGAEHVQSPEMQASIIRQMDSIGVLNDFFRKIERDSRLAEVSIKDADEAREEILAEERSHG